MEAFMHRKKVFSLLLCFIFLLTGCSQQAQRPSSTEDVEAAASILRTDAPKFTLAALEEGAYMGSGNAIGFYALEDQGSAYLITVIDYASAQKTYLCSSLSCPHNNETCTAWVPHEPESWSSIIAAPDRLLLLHHRTASPPCIEMLDLDGQNRSLLYTFPSGYSLASGAACSSGGVLVKAIDFSQKSYTPIYSLASSGVDATSTGYTKLFLRGTTDAGIVIKTVEMKEPRPVSKELDQEEYMRQSIQAQLDATVLSLVLLSYDDGQAHTLLDFSDGQCCELVTPDGLFYILCKKDDVPTLYKMDTKTGEKTVLIPDCLQSPLYSGSELFSVPDDWNLLYYIDGKLLIHTFTGQEVDNAQNMINSFAMYTVDAADSSVGEVTLSVYKNASWRPPMVYAEAGDRLLVDCGFGEKIVPKDSYEWQGGPLGLMSKQDFFSSNPVYTPVTVVG